MDLERLIAAEEKNEALIAAARAEAEGVIAEATREAAAREASLRQAVEQGVAEAEAKLTAEQARRIADLEEAARRTVARYDEVTDARLAEVVPALVDRLLGEGGP